MKILSLRIKNLSKVTELSKCRLRYETQVSVTPQPMLALYPPTPNPASSALPRTQVWVDQLATAMILQKVKLSSCSSFFIPTTHPQLLLLFPRKQNKETNKNQRTRIQAFQEPFSSTLKQTPRGNIIQCKAKNIFTVFASWKNNITFLMRPWLYKKKISCHISLLLL